MIEALLRFSIQNRIFVMLGAAVLTVLGIAGFFRLPIDAVPDVTTLQVIINTRSGALSPPEVEQQITFPIEWSMGGIPGVEQVRSVSRYGLSQVTVVFQDGTDIYRARQLVGERLQSARAQLPPGTPEPEMGPIATGLGEIFMWSVENAPGGSHDLTALRTIENWIVRPQLRSISGVNEINSIGGFEKVFLVAPDPAKLVAYGLTMRDVLRALEENNANAGGGFIRHDSEQYTIRTVGRVQSVEDISTVVLSAREGTPVLIRDIARVSEDHELRTGAATVDGREGVIGTAMMLMGENSRTVSAATARKVRDLAGSLPAGTRLRTLYDRTYLVDATLATVRDNLFEGALLVVAVLFLLLGNVRAALITALAIPLSMSFAVIGMVRYGISGNLMSLGAIDFGLIVDGAVIIVENAVRRIAERQHQVGRVLDGAERDEVVLQAALEVRRATMFGEAIIMIVYLPILTLSGIEGKIFHPMAYTVLFALAGAAVISMTVVPALASFVLRGSIAEREVGIVRLAKRLYEPLVHAAIRVPVLVMLGCVLLIAGSVVLGRGLGSEFIPRLGEGALAMAITRLPSINLDTSVAMQKETERLLLAKFPDEISHIFSRTGTAEVATDPQGPEMSDTYVILKPHAEWKRAHTQSELASQVAEELESMAGQFCEVSQPIELRVNELISGVKTDVAVKVFGERMDDLLSHAQRIAAVLQKVPGAADVRVEQVTGLPVLTAELDRKTMARHGLSVATVNEVVEIALGGRTAGEVLQGDRRFPLLVRLDDVHRESVEAIRELRIPLPEGPAPEAAVAATEPAKPRESRPRPDIPLSAIAAVSVQEGPNQISREDGKRRVVVQANVRDRDIGSFVEEARARIEAEVGRPPEGCWLTWGGQFENLLAARRRLAIVVPAALFLILVLLYASLASVRLSLLVFTGVPLALTGGVIGLWLRGMPFSISAAVGFIALSGVAVLNGLVMVSFIGQLHQQGMELREAIVQGSLLRLRPVLMTALVASLGFIPMALATSSGAEVQRPLATVVIGGLITSTLLTLVVIPSVYRFFR